MESLVYAVDWNQAREHVLSGAAWLAAGGGELIEPLRRPTALVCSSRGSQRVTVTGGRNKRDHLLIEHITETVAKGGTVLIPSDSSARILELAYLLEDIWTKEVASTDSPIAKARVYMASTTAGPTMRQARSMLEWMEEGIARNFEASTAAKGGQPSQAPFDFKFVKLLERKAQVSKALSLQGPKVIVASDSSLEWGFSQDILRSISQDRTNLLILTERSGQLSKTRKSANGLLWDIWRHRSGFNEEETVSDEAFATAFEADGAKVFLRDIQPEQLAGNELTLYQQFLARQRQLMNALNSEKGTTLEASVDVVDDRSSTTSESSEESDAEHQGKVLNTSAALASSRHKLGLSDAELGIDILIRRKGHYDWEVQGKKGRERIFPIIMTRRNQRGDDFGDAIRPEEYLRAEEREEHEEEELADREKRKETAVGSKRKWDDFAPQVGPKAMLNSSTKRFKAGDMGETYIARPDSAGGATTNGLTSLDPFYEGLEEEEEGQPEGPLKAKITEDQLPLNLRLAFVDFCGLYDKRSFQMLIPLIRPRKLILIGGDEDETLALAEDCKRLLNIEDQESNENTAEIFTPVAGTTIEASVDTNAWMLKLSKQFARHVQWQNVKGLSVVALTGRLDIITYDHPEEGVKKKLKTSEEKGEDTIQEKVDNSETMAQPVLDELPDNSLALTPIVAQPFHVGDVRLTELRKLMQAAGFSAEFRGEGTLLINGTVAVRKGGTGRLEVEAIMDLPALGGPDPTFYDVRRKVYEGLAVVAASA